VIILTHIFYCLYVCVITFIPFVIIVKGKTPSYDLEVLGVRQNMQLSLSITLQPCPVVFASRPIVRTFSRIYQESTCWYSFLFLGTPKDNWLKPDYEKKLSLRHRIYSSFEAIINTVSIAY